MPLPEKRTYFRPLSQLKEILAQIGFVFVLGSLLMLFIAIRLRVGTELIYCLLCLVLLTAVYCIAARCTLITTDRLRISCTNCFRFLSIRWGEIEDYYLNPSINGAFDIYILSNHNEFVIATESIGKVDQSTVGDIALLKTVIEERAVNSRTRGWSIHEEDDIKVKIEHDDKSRLFYKSPVMAHILIVFIVNFAIPLIFLIASRGFGLPHGPVFRAMAWFLLAIGVILESKLISNRSSLEEYGNGIRLKAHKTIYEVNWDDVDDYYLKTGTANAKSIKETRKLFIVVNGAEKVLPSVSNVNYERLQRLIVKKAKNSRTHGWAVLGTRPGDRPIAFTYSELEAKMLRDVAAIRIDFSLIALITMALIIALSSHHSHLPTYTWFFVVVIIHMLLFALSRFSRRYNWTFVDQHKEDRITIDESSITSTGIQEVSIPWGQVTSFTYLDTVSVVNGRNLLYSVKSEVSEIVYDAKLDLEFVLSNLISEKTGIKAVRQKR